MLRSRFKRVRIDGSASSRPACFDRGIAVRGTCVRDVPARCVAPCECEVALHFLEPHALQHIGRYLLVRDVGRAGIAIHTQPGVRGRRECVVDDIESLRVGGMDWVVGTAAVATAILFAGTVTGGAGLSALGLSPCWRGRLAAGGARRRRGAQRILRLSLRNHRYLRQRIRRNDGRPPQRYRWRAEGACRAPA